MRIILKALLAILFVSSLNCYSQTSNFGIKAGFNAATITGFGIEGHIKLKAGYHFGLVGQFNLNEKWILQPEILFSNQGYRTERFRYTFNYINFPILLKRQYKSFFFDVGPQVGVLLNAKKTDLSDPPDNKDISSEIANLELAMATGIGFKASKNIGLECRYSFDLPISTDGADSGFSNSVIQLSITYMFK